jgi:hypothetical protein
MEIFVSALIATVAAHAIAGAPVDSRKPVVKPDIEIRSRFERRTDKDFTKSANDNRTDLLTRIRPGVTISKDNWVVRLQAQYAHDLIWSKASNKSTENKDMSLAYLQVKENSRTVTLGRQYITLNDERLVGAGDWTQLGRSFDGVRVKSANLDLFAAKVGLQTGISHAARLYGASIASKYGTTTLLVKTDKVGAARSHVNTLDHLWKGKVGDLSAQAEIALQGGRTGGKDLGAFAIQAGVSKALPNNLTIGAEFSMASGGSSATKTKTFDNLYPTNHKFYGSADMVGWRNIQELAVKASYKTKGGASFKFGHHHFWLFDKKDGFYGAGGGLNKGLGGANLIDPTGASGRYLGSEFDLEYSRPIGKSASVAAGVATFTPGGFIKARNGGSAKAQNWLYVKYEIKL